MNVVRPISLLLIIAISTAISSFAFETDQYNLSPVPLADIGDEVSEHVEQRLYEAMAGVNSEIEKGAKCIEVKAKGCSSPDAERRKLERLRSNEAVTEAVFKLLGEGNVFTTTFGNWMRAHKFRGQPDRYKTSYGESIYLLNPLNYATISPTVRLYGAEFGIDKLEHFFQQGYKYYTIEREALAKGASETESSRKAIKWGQRTERTYYGLLASGVYSNADLYANYAGMRFYEGLTKPLTINGRSRPATLQLTDGKWTLDTATLRENLLKPFLTDHMNEAWNPSAFRFTLVRSIRRAVKKYACPDWQRFYPKLTQTAIAERSRALELWNGEDYGFTKKSRIVTIGETCFGRP